MPEIRAINKGDKFLCYRTFRIHNRDIFICGKEYLSSEDHCLTDEDGTGQFGWNLDILNNHFIAID